MNPIAKALVFPFVRHALTVVSGFFLAHGMTTEEGALQISNLSDVLTGIVIGLGGLGWSYVEKFFKKTTTVPEAPEQKP